MIQENPKRSAKSIAVCWPRLLSLAVPVALGLAIPAAWGQATLTTLASLNGSNGADPAASLSLSGSTLFGTTWSGGAYGSGVVFSVPITGGTPAVLTSFDSSYGAEVNVIVSGTTLYGVTAYGGDANGDGTVFSLPVGGGTPTVLTSFNRMNGSGPSSGLILSGNTLYGATAYGGGYPGASTGVVFGEPINGGAPTSLAVFDGDNRGGHSSGNLILSSNTLYGTALWGGDLSLNYGLGDGVVFSVPISGGTPKVLATFEGTNGASPFTGVILSGNTLYGTTPSGGIYGDGEVYSVPITGGTLTVMNAIRLVRMLFQDQGVELLSRLGH